MVNKLTERVVSGVTLVVFWPLGAVFHVVEVPTRGVHNLVAHRDSAVYVGHVAHPNFNDGVVGKLKDNISHIIHLR